MLGQAATNRNVLKFRLLFLSFVSRFPPLQVVVESDFVKYEGKFEDYVSGSIETSLGKISLGASGKGIVASHSSFGNLKKQQADLQNLMKESQGRSVWVVQLVSL